MGVLKWMLGLGLVATVGVGAGVYFAFFGAGPQITYVTPDLVPINLDTTVSEVVPLNNWVDRQHTCEEATLLMVDRYLRGDHSGALIDPQTADAAINQITSWKP